MAKTYRTAKGKTIDLGAFISKNETTRAVGNMNVNARGDLLDSENKKIESRNTRINREYRKQIRNTVVDDPVYSSKRAATKADSADKKSNKNHENLTEIAKQYASPETAIVEPTPVTEDPAVVTEDPQEKGGLAAAIAKARQVKQEPLKTPRQKARESSGVKKI